MVTKTEILKDFKNCKNIKMTLKYYKPNNEIKGIFLYNLRQYDNNIKESDIIEDDTGFYYKDMFVFKNKGDKNQIIEKLPNDIKSNKITDYDKLNGLWLETEFAKYKFIGE